MGITLYPAVLYTGTTLGEADAAALAAAGVDEIVLPETAHTSGTVGDNVTRSAEWDREGGNLEILSGISSHKDVLFTASGRGLNLPLFRSMLDMLKMYEAEITVKSLDARQTYLENAEKDRARLEAELAGRERDIVDEDNDVLRRYFVEVSGFADRLAGVVHEGLWLYDEPAFTAEDHLTADRLEARAVDLEVIFFCEVIDS